MTGTLIKLGDRRLSGARLASCVAAAAAGDLRAWERLVENFSGMLWGVARAHRLNDADAAEVVQGTWVKLLDHLGNLHEPERVGSWLATTARRECLRVLRHAQRNLPIGDDLLESAPVSAQPAMDDELIVAERAEALWRSFSRLRPNDQALLRLLVSDPCPGYPEISAALGLPVGSIGPTRARALERLRRELGRAGALGLMAA